MTFCNNPKRKNYVLCPKGKALYEDNNRFGTKMLEKMGWTKGKGLGANLDGNQDFIKISYKSDQQGFGFTDRDDQWTQHESNFNSLLKSFDDDDNSNDKEVELNIDEKSTEIGDKTKKLFSGKSLEEQSKKSRARVHYKKFTRGKDLSRYNEKDLANIFGKKSLNENPESVAIETVEENDNEEKDIPNFGITTIETSISVNDYFKDKMKRFFTNKTSEDGNVEENIEEEVKSSKKKSKKRKKCDEEVLCEELVNEVQEINDDFLSEKPEKSAKKKKKKNKGKDEDVTISNDQNIHIEVDNRINKNDENVQNQVENIDDEPIKKSKKKKKKKNQNEEKYTNAIDENTSEIIPEMKPDELIENSENVETEPKKKRKKKVKKIDFSPNSLILNLLEKIDDPNLRSNAGNNNEDNTKPPEDGTFDLGGFKAEIFRVLDLEGFSNSTLCDILGYGYGSNIQLKVTPMLKDSQKLMSFWDQALINKYGQNAVPKKIKNKNKYSITKLSNKNVFKF